MSTAVITAVDHRHEADLVAGLEGQRGIEVVRRCADVAELLSVAAAGAAEVALVSGGLRGVDREVIRALAGHGVAVLGVLAPGDEAGERTLRQLGVSTIVRAGTPAADVAASIIALSGAGNPSGPESGKGTGRSFAAGPDVPRSAGAREGNPGHATREGSPGHATREDRTALGHPDRDLPPDPFLDNDIGEGSLDHDEVSQSGDGTSLHGVPGEVLGVALSESRLEESPATVVALWGPLGSPGRTTLAVTLAAILAAREISVLLIDADTHGASVAQVLGLIDESPGIAAAARLSDQGSLDLASLSRVSPEVSPRLRVLTGLPRADRWPEIRSGAMEDLLTVARRLAQVVIVDCGHAMEDDEELSYDTAAPRRNAATLSALAEADLVLAVGAADPVGLQRLVRGLGDLTHVGVAHRIVVVNKVRASAAGSRPERAIREVLERFSGLHELDFLPWAPGECDAALWAGRSLVEVAPGAPLTLAISRLADRISPAPSVSRSSTLRRGQSRRGVRARARG